MNHSKYKQIYDYFKYLKRPERYIGRRPITTRSSWESKFISSFLDSNPNVISWSSEDVIIPYRYSLDGKIHRYFMDFHFKIKDNDGNIKEYLIEIKPAVKLLPPKIPKRITKGYKNAKAEFIKNQNKFEAAEKFCKNLREQKGIDIEFKIFTEKDLDIRT